LYEHPVYDHRPGGIVGFRRRITTPGPARRSKKYTGDNGERENDTVEVTHGIQICCQYTKKISPDIKKIRRRVYLLVVIDIAMIAGYLTG